MSLLLSARYVHAPRRARRCDDCGRLLGPHIYLYGSAHGTERPWAMRLCITHLDASAGPKIAAALTAARARAEEVAAEAARLAAWNSAGAPPAVGGAAQGETP